MKEELVYWVALSQIKNWSIEKINQLLIKVIHEDKMLLSEFFNFDNTELKNKFDLNEKEIISLIDVKTELPKFSFLTEDLLAQGYEIITIDSPKYSKTLKDNLKIKSSPPVIYVKGNTQLLHEKSIAIVGSRDADEISLNFTDDIAKRASKDFKVIVSGFAKGIDKQALDSAIKYKGQSIIVLPQGIMTFGSGFNKYYKEIQTGDVLVLSTFFPKVPWSVQLAMARNPIIYGLANEIYVAQSGDKGGTWSGVIDGLRKGREIYVRVAGDDEKNANNLLIERGAIPVDNIGNIIPSQKIDNRLNEHTNQVLESKYSNIKKDISVIGAEEQENLFDEHILKILKESLLSSGDVIHILKLDWKTQKMTNYLKKIPDIKTFKEKNITKFTLKEESQNSLFGG